jgi:hypothetical protein
VGGAAKIGLKLELAKRPLSRKDLAGAAVAPAARTMLAQAPKPPSIVCIAPVTNVASGPANQATIPATSSGRP